MPDKLGRSLLTLTLLWTGVTWSAEANPQLTEEFLEYLGEYLMEDNEWLDPLEVELMASGDPTLAPSLSAEVKKTDVDKTDEGQVREVKR